MIKKLLNLNKKINQILNLEERKKLNSFKFIVFINALIELIGISVIVPFIFCVLNIEKIFSYEIVNKISNVFYLKNEFSFLVFLGSICIFITLAINLISFYSNYKSIELSQLLSVNLRSRLFNFYLQKNYFYHLTKNSNELINNFLGETIRISEGIILPIINMQLKLVVIFIIFITLIYLEPVPTIIIFSTIIFFYLQVYKKITKKITSLGLKTKIYNDQIGKYGYPSINDIKNTKIYSLEDFYNKNIRYFFNRDSKVKLIVNSISILPKQIIDFFLIVFAIIVILIFLNVHGGVEDFLPIVGAFIYAAGKIIPQANQVFNSLTSIRNNMPAFENVADDLQHSLNINLLKKKILPFKDKLELKNISFGYPGGKKDQKRTEVINNLSISINQKDKIGIYGKSGNGKSTLADIISGLIKPHSGEFILDNKKILEDVDYFNFRNLVCYISQAPFLIKDTLEKNIAFQQKEINMEKLAKASQLAECENFINQLPNKYKTVISDRLNFSGGQSQRLSLARAFYLKKQITILDECTSSLDMLTEKKVMENIYKYFENETLIIISHRINNLKECNRIFEFTDKGLIEKNEKI